MKNSSLKIGIFFNLTSYGGVQTCIISLIRGLNREGIIPVILSDEDVNKKILEENSVVADEKKIKFSVSKKILNRFKPYLLGFQDIVYFYKISWLDTDYDFLFFFQPNIIVNKEVNYLYYLSMSPMAYGFSQNKVLSFLKNTTYRYLIKKFHPVYEFHNRNCVINSQYTANYFEKVYKKKIEVIYPSNSLAQQRTELNFARKDIVFLSRLTPQKRPDIFIDLAQKHPELNFRIIGSVDNGVYLRRLLENVVTKNIVNVIFRTNLTRDEVNEELKTADIFVFPAENEHFGIATVEAMMMGVIPFVHDSGGQKEIVPFEELRFNYNKMDEKFNNLIQLNSESKNLIRKKILERSSYFSEEKFIESMLKYLPKQNAFFKSSNQ